MPFVHEHFGCQVLRSPAQSVGPRFDMFCESEVRQHKESLAIDEQILRLQVSIDNVFAMEVLEHERNLRREEAGVVRLDRSFSPEVGKELATGDVLQEEIKVLIVLSEAIEADLESKGLRERDGRSRLGLSFQRSRDLPASA